MFYTIYKTTNLINNKTYIGKHQTKNPNDEYLGSGRLLKRAIKKYGEVNFKKEVLFIFDTEKEMDEKEKDLVVINENSYNLCDGGHGGFGFLNREGRNWTPELVSRMSKIASAKMTKEQKKARAILGGLAAGGNNKHHDRLKTDPEYKKLFCEKLSSTRKGKLTPKGRNTLIQKLRGNQNRKKK